MDAARIAANQQRTFLALWAEIRPFVAADSSLPRRIRDRLARDRAFGSRDRRLYRELIYTAIRFLPWIDSLSSERPDDAAALVAWLAPETPDTTRFRTAIAGDWPALPADIEGKATTAGRRLSREFSPVALLPAWFREHCPQAFASPHLDRLNERARIWVRLQCRDAQRVIDEFLAHRWSVSLDESAPEALGLPANAEVADTDAYRRGFIEIQDLGSQLILQHLPDLRGQRWLDACAGAGGKTLQLARRVGDQGQVDAFDIRAAALDELRERAARSKQDNIRVIDRPADSYDGVLVDAPCSGSGTWRRLPHIKWHTRPAMIAEFAAIQLGLLRENALRLRPGGLLVYATCSLSSVENSGVVAAFLADHPDFQTEAPAQELGGIADPHGRLLLPGDRDSDGFYVALLRRQT
ncbi:MAG TPA: RsmB/NOP family class I SAM-dependent RNA methyltransferase [Candidatus Didemnitutus sp.]|nr:RsmB/NOP family class I SAM-dependent RNA methyltransferase [Candidatus Didemnitutus sp.]